MLQSVSHTLEPFFQEDSKILILGTMPSPKSRELGFYYGHPQNRFWRVLAAVLNCPLPCSNREKMALLAEHHIALWDVLASCEIDGASDQSIRNPITNDITWLVQNSQVQQIFTTGTKAHQLYRRYCEADSGIKAISLPSTSPANCSRKLEDLIGAYRVILDYLA